MAAKQWHKKITTLADAEENFAKMDAYITDLNKILKRWKKVFKALKSGPGDPPGTPIPPNW